VQAYFWREIGHDPSVARCDATVGPVTRAALLTLEAAATVDALFGPWEAQLEASLGRLAALQSSLEAQASRLRGLEIELALLTPGANRQPTADRA
jgi:hypothetical protein